MGFLLQLRILLWKNLTFKRRSSLVLLFEVFIPLVLFVILLCIRKKQPAYPKPDYHSDAKPLPSAGVIAVMQAFCDGGKQDARGFPDFPNATVHSFLENFQQVAENNNFFDPGFSPSELDRIPQLYERIIDDPAMIHNRLAQAQGMQLDKFFGHANQLADELSQTFSLPRKDVETLLSARVNFTEVFRLMSHLNLISPVNNDKQQNSDNNDNSDNNNDNNNHDNTNNSSDDNDNSDNNSHDNTNNNGDSKDNNHDNINNDNNNIVFSDHRLRRREIASKFFPLPSPSLSDLSKSSALQDVVQSLPDSFQNLLPGEGEDSLTPDSVIAGLVKAVAESSGGAWIASAGSNILFEILMSNPELLTDPRFMRIVVALMKSKGRPSVDMLMNVDMKDLVDVLMKLLLSKASLRHLACDNHEMSKILTFSNRSELAETVQLERKMCNFSSDQWETFVKIINRHIQSEDMINKLDLKDVNLTVSYSRLQNFESNLEEFIRFERNLAVLSKFADKLPQSACVNGMHTTTPPTAEDSTTTSPDYLLNAGSAKQGRKPLKRGASPNIGLLRIWLSMQKTLCGSSTKSADPAADESTNNAESLDSIKGLTDKQKRNLGILVQMLYNNPRVLYAPNNTAAEKVIRKANGTFELVDLMSTYARKWTTVSSAIRSYLLLNRTEQNLEHIRQIQMELQSKPGLLQLIRSREVRTFLQNPNAQSNINRSIFLSQLDVVDNAACSWLELISGIDIVNVFQGFASEEELVNYFLNDAYHDGVVVMASIVFTNLNEDGSLPPHVIYKIRQNASFTSTTKSVRDKYWHPGPNDSPYGFDSYYQFGFVWIQDIIERAIISLQVEHDVLEPGTFVHQIPYPCYMEDKFLFMIEHVMPLCLTISWVYTVAMLVQSVVYEKEQRLKEVMRMMGLSNCIHWLAWFITSFVQMSVTMALLTIILKYGSVLMYSNPVIIFLVLEMFAVATICFSTSFIKRMLCCCDSIFSAALGLPDRFLISVCYSKAKIAAACAGIIYFLSYVPYMYIALREMAGGDRISIYVKTLASLLSTTVFGFGAKYFALYEIEGVGVQWDNLSVSPVEDDQYSLLLVILMMIFDTLLYSLLTWYIENVHPGSYGLPKPWYFPLTRSYWCGHQAGSDSDRCDLITGCYRTDGYHGEGNGSAPLSVTEEDQACAMNYNNQADRLLHFEVDPQHVVLGVHIDHLTKVYKRGGKVAVNNLNLNLYEGQITAFLGHNGAGKTTTMSILTGLFPPTSGTASVYGLDIRTDMEDIRKTLGMCPQHNVLFDKLTVEEHLWLYSRLKGLPAALIPSEMDRMIDDLGLQKKRKNTVDCLSGGMKRKLSVAIAFVAGSRTIILDEPTAGVDPYARRAIWDLLLKYKNGRTILLSTHHMDEADILGDRIAIISNGQLKCCGSSMFLKSMFGSGYHLVLVKKRSDEDLQSIDTLSLEDTCAGARASFHSKCSAEKTTAFLQEHIRTIYLKMETSQELHYVVPFEEARKGGFARLFEFLDRAMDDLKLSSYGVSDSSVEEVFLTITGESASSASKPGVEAGGGARGMESRGGASGESPKIKDYMPSASDVVGLNNLEPVTHSEVHHSPPMASHHGNQSERAIHQSSITSHHDSQSESANHQSSVMSHRNHIVDDDEVELDNMDFSTPLLSSVDPEGRTGAGALAPPSAETLAPPRVGLHRRQPSSTSSLDCGDDVPLLSLGGREREEARWSTGWMMGEGCHSLPVPGSGETGPGREGRVNDLQEGGRRHCGSTYEHVRSVVNDGAGRYVLVGYALYMQQFLAVIIKRFNYTRRSWKGLFSQILLPALFVCIAMTVALSAPHLQDLPPITLTPAQYYNYTQPRGNIVPYAIRKNSEKTGKHYSSISELKWSKDASADDIVKTFHLPSGIAATCVLKTPSINGSFDVGAIRAANSSLRNFRLVDRYVNAACKSVFVGALPLMNFVPPASIVDPNNRNETMITGNNTATNFENTIKYYPDCACAADHTGQVCASDGFQEPSRFQVVTGDYLLDISATDDEETYYLRTADIYRLRRYGGYTFGLLRDTIPRTFGKNGPTEFRKLAVRHLSLLWFDTKGYHSMPVYLNALNNAILRANLPKAKGNPAAYGITAINHPMNNTNNQLSLEYIKQGSDVIIAIFIICAMSFVPASFVLFLVHERSMKAKHLQIVSGLNRVIYWVANYTWDIFNYLIPGTCCIIILKGFDIPAYVSSTNFPCVISLFLFYGWSITPMMYPASFLFKEPSTAYICLIVINLFIGITCILTSFLLELFQQNSRDLARIHDVLKNIFLVFPNYCLGRGLMDVAFNEYQNEFHFKTGNYDQMKSPFEWRITSRNIVSMAAMGLVFFVITLLCEFKFFIKQKHAAVDNILIPVEEDVDVAAERRRVLRGSGKHDLLRLQNLTKVYKTRKLGNQLAVDRLCLGVPAGECFGLLGVNGAGKTTTFKLLTGDDWPTGGNAIIDGHSIVTSIYKAQQKIGYCPQFDALYDELTAREHLQLFARLRGIPPSDQKQVVEWALKKLCLSEYSDKTAGTFSGGNKRKLSTAIALLGHPPIIFLDEPTTGMDPHSRRFLWDLILDLIQDGRSVVLTSHSMEECEALCTRLAVMVNGRFHCLGSTQHLKDKYGDGYTMTVRIRGGGANVEREILLVRRFISRHLPLAVLKECHHNVLQYEFPSSGLSLAMVFARMEEACEDLQIEEYSISQNTLDNVFVNFVKQQQEIVQETEQLVGESTEGIGGDGRGGNEEGGVLLETMLPLSERDDELLEDVCEDEPLILDPWSTGNVTGRREGRLAFLNMEIANA